MHVNPNPRNKFDLLMAGAATIANNLYEQGYSGARLAAQLALRFPRAFAQSIRAVMDYVIAARAAARRQSQLPPGGTVPKNLIPTTPAVQRGYRYRMDIAYEDPRTHELKHIPIWKRSDSSMSVDQLRQWAAYIIGLMTDDTDLQARTGQTLDELLDTIDLISIEGAE